MFDCVIKCIEMCDELIIIVCMLMGFSLVVKGDLFVFDKVVDVLVEEKIKVVFK